MTTPNELNDQLIQITDTEVINILKELHAYHNVRKQHRILNCPKLIELLRLYCSILLDDRSKIRGKSTMLLNGQFYEVGFLGHDLEGNSRETSLSDGFKGFIDFLSIDLNNSLDSTCFKSLTKLLTAVIQHPGINSEHKYIILRAENELLQNAYEFYLWDLSESEIRYFFDVRKNFVLEQIGVDKNNTDNLNGDNLKLQSLYDTYKYFISRSIKNLSRTNKVSDIVDLLDNELRNCDDQVLGTFLLWTTIINNNLYLFMNKDAIQQKVVDFSHLIQENNRQLINDALNFSLTDFDFKDQVVEPVGANLTDIDFDKTKTVIFATIPLKLLTNSPWSTAIDSISITLRSIKNPIDDPIHNFIYDSIVVF